MISYDIYIHIHTLLLRNFDTTQHFLFPLETSSARLAAAEQRCVDEGKAGGELPPVHHFCIMGIYNIYYNLPIYIYMGFNGF